MVFVGRADRELLERTLAGLDRRGTVAMMCGPGPMVVAVSDTLGDLGLPQDANRLRSVSIMPRARPRGRPPSPRQFLLVGAGLAAGIALFAVFSL